MVKNRSHPTTMCKQKKCAPQSPAKPGLTQKKADAIFSMGWERNRVLSVATAWKHDSLRPLLLITRLIQQAIKIIGHNEQRKKVLHRNNAKPPDTSSTTQMETFDEKILIHLSPSDYHLFRSLESSFNGISWVSMKRYKIHLSQKFCSDEIMVSAENGKRPFIRPTRI